MTIMSRRAGLALLATLAIMPLTARGANYSSLAGNSFSFPSIQGGDIRLADFKGRPILIVNTASQCGFSGQMEGLQQLYNRFGSRGLIVIAVPSNDFGGQEPGGAAEIMAYVQGQYHATFPIAAKQVVKGADSHPFYRWAAEQRPSDTPRWNFHKYLIGRDGRLAAVFPTIIEPTDPRVVAAIVAELDAN